MRNGPADSDDGSVRYAFNFQIGQCQILLELSRVFPELTAAPEWPRRALARITDNVVRNTLPDGGYVERSAYNYGVSASIADRRPPVESLLRPPHILIRLTIHSLIGAVLLGAASILADPRCTVVLTWITQAYASAFRDPVNRRRVFPCPSEAG